MNIYPLLEKVKKNLTDDVTSNGIRMQIGVNPADAVPKPRKPCKRKHEEKIPKCEASESEKLNIDVDHIIIKKKKKNNMNT